ncbi:MAG: WbqC family protein [Candidatus Methylomirabilales bacterium]
MRVVILQPSYLPWLGYFDQLYRSEVFVLYDDVQFDKHGWRNRNRIKTAAGPQWLTVPVRTGGLGPQPINRIAIVNGGGWPRKHLTALRLNYSRAPFFGEYIGAFEALYARPWERLLDLNLAALEILTEALGLRRRVVLSSALGIPGRRLERLLQICQALGAQTYLTGDAAEGYLDGGLFAAHGIAVEFHRYRHPVYRQLHGDFIPYLSVVDLLFNAGPDSLAILTHGEAREATTCARS